MVRKYSHITYEQRVLLEKMYKNINIIEIAKKIGVSKQSLYRELSRCPKGNYSAELAQEDVNRKKNNGVEARKRGIMKNQYIIEDFDLSDPIADLKSISEATGIPIEKLM